MSEVDNAISQVLTNQQRVESTKNTRTYIEETVEAEEEKFKQGSSTTFTVLRLRRDYSDAKNREIRAKIDLEKSAQKRAPIDPGTIGFGLSAEKCFDPVVSDRNFIESKPIWPPGWGTTSGALRVLR